MSIRQRRACPHGGRAFGGTRVAVPTAALSVAVDRADSLEKNRERLIGFAHEGFGKLRIAHSIESETAEIVAQLARAASVQTLSQKERPSGRIIRELPAPVSPVSTAAWS